MNAVASSGSLIGAILESVGYHYQSHILDALAAPFTNEVGGLIYLVGIAIAVAATATQGKYNLGAWLLIGPPLFFAVIQVREPTDNARWRFGRQDRNSAEVDTQVNQLAAENMAAAGGRANVSKLFGRYVRMISTVMQEIVAVIAENRNKTDLWFIVRGELYGLMHTGRIDDPYLERLMHLSLIGHCGEVIEWGRAVSDPLFRERKNAEKNENDKTPEVQQSKRIAEEPKHQDAIQKFRENYEKRDLTLDREAAMYVALLEAEAEAEAAGEAAAAVDSAEVEAKAQAIEYGQNLSCKQIWNYTLLGLKKNAKREAETLFNRGEALGIDRNALGALMLQLHGISQPGASISYNDNPNNGPTDLTPVDIQNIQRIIAKYYLRNEFRNPSKAAWMARFITHVESRDLRTRLQGKNSFTEQTRLGASEWSEKERAMHAAGSLPYYQGLLLYFLGTTFPFFALLLLVPGKHGGFILWFTLWLWVKSWDIGMAIVMVLDDFFFAMLATQRISVAQMSGKTEADAANEELSFAFATLQEMDPTFHLTTYYTIMAVCILAIPATSAQLILGSMRGGATLVASGMQKYADFFSSARLMGYEQIGIMGNKDLARQLKMERSKRYAENVSQGLKMSSGVTDNRGLPYDPQETSPIWNYNQRTAGGAQAGIGGKDGQGNTYAAGRARLDDMFYRSSAASGLNAPDRVLNASTNLLMGGGIKAFTADMRILEGTRAGQQMALWKGDKEAVGAWANWDADISQLAEDYYERIAMLGGLPIPWSNFSNSESHPSSQEFSLAIQRFEYEQKMRMAEWDAHKELYDSFLQIATSVAKGTAQVGRDNRPQLLTMDEVEKLDPAVRAEIGSRFGNYLRERNLLRSGVKTAAYMAGTAGIGHQFIQDVGEMIYGPATEAPSVYHTGDPESLHERAEEDRVNHASGGHNGGFTSR